jgi:hypothetical protein
VRHSLDQTIGSSPVSTVDLDAVVATGRRRRVWRRMSVAGAAGGSLVAIGVVAALVFTPGGTPAPNRAQPPAAAGTTTAATNTAPRHPGETTDQTKQRLATALHSGLSAALPGVQVGDGPTGQSGVLVYLEGSGAYTTDTVLTTPAGQGEVFLVSWPTGLPAAQTPTSSSTDGQRPPIAVVWVTSCADLPYINDAQTWDGKQLVFECADSVGLQGQTVVAVTQRCTGCAGQPVLGHDVYVTWSNARVNLSIARDTKRGEPGDSLTAPLLSRDQLIALAVNPDLAVAA